MLRASVRLLLDQPSRALGTLLGVVMSTFLMAQQLSTFLGILGRVAAFSDGTEVDVWIASPTTIDTDITDSVPLRYRAAAASTPGVAHASAVVQGMTRATRPDGVRELVKVVGVEAPRYTALPRALDAAGRARLAAPGRLLISEADRPLYGGAQPGDRVELGGRTMIVAGFFDGVDPHGNYSYMFTNLADARAITGLAPERATFIAVTLTPGADGAQVAAVLRRRLPDARVFTRAEMRAAVVGHFIQRTPVGMVFGLGIIVAALVGSLIVGVTMFSSAVDRTRDFATLRAIGATRRDLLELLLGQAALFFVAGTSVGLIAFAIVKTHAAGVPMASPPWMIGAVAAASLMSCLLASLAAIRRVLAVDPAIVFRG